MLWYLDLSTKKDVKDIIGLGKHPKSLLTSSRRLTTASPDGVATEFLAWITEARAKVETDSLVWDLAVCKTLNDIRSFGGYLRATFGLKIWLPAPRKVGMSQLPRFLKTAVNPLWPPSTARIFKFYRITQLVEFNLEQLSERWTACTHIRDPEARALFQSKGNPYLSELENRQASSSSGAEDAPDVEMQMPDEEYEDKEEDKDEGKHEDEKADSEGENDEESADAAFEQAWEIFEQAEVGE